MKKQRKLCVFGESGFTLVELLLVVAIIAVLVAVSIPMISNSLEKSRHATDAANEKAAKSELYTQYMAGEDGVVDGTPKQEIMVLVSQNHGTTGVYFYDAASGSLKSWNEAKSIKPYGTHGSHKGKILELAVLDNGRITMQWVEIGHFAYSAGMNSNISAAMERTCNNRAVDADHGGQYVNFGNNSFYEQ